MYRKEKLRTTRSKKHLESKNADADNSSLVTRSGSKPFKRKIFYSTLVLAIAVAVPVIFAMAADSNEVAYLAAIPQATQIVVPSPSPSPSPTETPATANGVLTSDLTETSQAAATPTPTPSPSPTPLVTPAPTPQTAYTKITPGMDDPFVAVIQERLMNLDYMEQDDPTTLLGPITTQAIQYFQRKNGLPEDGEATVDTQKLLFSENAKPYTVSEGASGPDVQSIQDRLGELGYSVGLTGYFGTDTTKAVSYFQRMNGLAEDGNVGSDTREKLYANDAEPSLEFTKQHASSGNSKSSGTKSSGTKSSTKPSNSAASGGSGGKTSNAPAPAANPGNVEAFINAALSQLGKPYVWGGKGPNVFDCSGFVYYSLKISGNGIGYMTSAGWHNSGYTKISKMSDLQRGDIIDYRGHVGIYLGDGKMVDASSSEGKIRISGNIFTTSYWTSHFLEGRRLF